MTADSWDAKAVERLHGVWRRRRWLCLFVFALGATVALSAVTSLPDIYSAAATVVVEPSPGLQDVPPEEAEQRIHRLTERIRTRDRLQSLIARFGLYEDLRRRAPEDAVLLRMRRDLRVDTVGPEAASRTVTAFTIRYRGADPLRVAGVVNALAEMFVEEDRKLLSGDLAALAAQLAVMRERLESQERELAAFQERHPGELAEHQVANLAALSRLDNLLRLNGEARARAMERRSRLQRELAEGSSAGADPASAEARLAALKRDLAELRRTYTDRYPDVARLQREIADLEGRAATPASAPADGPAAALREVELELRSLKDEDERLRRDAAVYARRVEAAPQTAPAFREMTRDYETTGALYNLLLQRVEEGQLVAPQQGRGGEVRLLEAARPPREPVGPNRLHLAVLGVILALAAAAGAAALAEQLDSSFHSADELRRFTRVPVLASVPRIVGPRGAWRDRLRRTLVAAGSLLLLALAGQAAHRAAVQGDEVAALLTRAR